MRISREGGGMRKSFLMSHESDMAFGEGSEIKLYKKEDIIIIFN